VQSSINLRSGCLCWANICIIFLKQPSPQLVDNCTSPFPCRDNSLVPVMGQ
jgi:hypothetical protein